MAKRSSATRSAKAAQRTQSASKGQRAQSASKAQAVALVRAPGSSVAEREPMAVTPKATAARPTAASATPAAAPATRGANQREQAARLARARATQNARAASRISPENYGYVLRDLRLTGILAGVMFTTIIILHFVLG